MVPLRFSDPRAAAVLAVLCLCVIGCYEPGTDDPQGDVSGTQTSTGSGVAEDETGDGDEGTSTTGTTTTGVTGSESDSGPEETGAETGTETGDVACDPPTELDVLFIGNSFTQGEDLPGLVELLGQQAGIDIRTGRVTQGGRTLAMQVADPAVAMAIGSQPWDYVVIQGNSTEPLTNLEAFLSNGQTLVSWVEMAGSEPRLYQTWARSAANPGYATNPSWGGSPTVMQGYIREAYDQLSALTGAPVVPVGDAWEATWAVAPEINLYASDEYHQNIAGAYLNASVFFAALTDLSPVGNVGEPPAGVSPEEALILQQQAEFVVQPSCR